MLRIAQPMLEEIRRQARGGLPYEICGYLAGDDHGAHLCYPMRNVDQSAEHYAFDPKEQFGALKWVRERGVRLVATYHSHPESAARMSAEDVRLAIDPGLQYLIYSVPDDELRAYRVERVGQDTRVTESEIEWITPSPAREPVLPQGGSRG